MSIKTLSWILLSALALSAVLLLNYWASYQLLSTLAYTGIVAALAGLANLALPFRFLGVRKRAVGALVFAGGVTLTLAALFWPASTVRVAQTRTRLDAIMPEYQYFEKHSARVHARPAQILQATRESTFSDMKSLGTLLKIRGAALRIHDTGESLKDKRILEAFSVPGFLQDGSEREIVMFWAASLRAGGLAKLGGMQEFRDYRDPGAVKMAFNISVEDAGDGWSTLSTETRVMATDDATRRGMGTYWRMIVPGSGLLRRQWLDGIRKRAEAMPEPQS